MLFLFNLTLPLFSKALSNLEITTLELFRMFHERVLAFMIFL